MKVLLVGGSGMVGTFITPYLMKHHELRALDPREPGHDLHPEIGATGSVSFRG